MTEKNKKKTHKDANYFMVLAAVSISILAVGCLCRFYGIWNAPILDKSACDQLMAASVSTIFLSVSMASLLTDITDRIYWQTNSDRLIKNNPNYIAICICGFAVLFLQIACYIAVAHEVAPYWSTLVFFMLFIDGLVAMLMLFFLSVKCYFMREGIMAQMRADFMSDTEKQNIRLAMTGQNTIDAMSEGDTDRVEENIEFFIYVRNELFKQIPGRKAAKGEEKAEEQATEKQAKQWVESIQNIAVSVYAAEQVHPDMFKNVIEYMTKKSDEKDIIKLFAAIRMQGFYIGKWASRSFDGKVRKAMNGDAIESIAVVLRDKMNEAIEKGGVIAQDAYWDYEDSIIKYIKGSLMVGAQENMVRMILAEKIKISDELSKKLQENGSDFYVFHEPNEDWMPSDGNNNLYKEYFSRYVFIMEGVESLESEKKNSNINIAKFLKIFSQILHENKEDDEDENKCLLERDKDEIKCLLEWFVDGNGKKHVKLYWGALLGMIRKGVLEEGLFEHYTLKYRDKDAQEEKEKMVEYLSDYLNRFVKDIDEYCDCCGCGDTVEENIERERKYDVCKQENQRLKEYIDWVVEKYYKEGDLGSKLQSYWSKDGLLGEHLQSEVK